jgi:hypothetical protein
MGKLCCYSDKFKYLSNTRNQKEHNLQITVHYLIFYAFLSFACISKTTKLQFTCHHLNLKSLDLFQLLQYFECHSYIERAVVQWTLRLATGWTTEGSELKCRWEQEFSLLQIVQAGSGAHPASYPMGSGVCWSFPAGKAVEERS